jgi:competence protein ComEC
MQAALHCLQTRPVQDTKPKDSAMKSALLLSPLLLCLGSGLQAEDEVMRVHIIEVGQANATLVEFPQGVMLVDAGGELATGYDGTDELMKYLKAFFERRQDLAQRDHPIDLLAITHPHKDHTAAIPQVISTYPPANVIHNHQETGSGIQEQNLAVDFVRQTEANGYYIIQDRAVQEVLRSGHGLTNDVIDPFEAEDGGPDPRITVLWGGLRNNQYWDYDDYADENNHSLVIRVDYGEASILFPGDIEEAIEDQETRFDKAAVEHITELYGNTGVLDVDVYLASHHASRNGASKEFLQRVTPEIAVISCGPPVARVGGLGSMHLTSVIPEKKQSTKWSPS